jgi:hypothetical protein
MLWMIFLIIKSLIYSIRGESLSKELQKNSPRTTGLLTTPLSERGIPKFFIYLLSLVGAIYILNPGSGIIELLPDNLPFVGNLDEGGAFIAIWYGLIEFFEGRK